MCDMSVKISKVYMPVFSPTGAFQTKRTKPKISDRDPPSQGPKTSEMLNSSRLFHDSEEIKGTRLEALDSLL